jgi:hypothetical protein
MSKGIETGEVPLPRWTAWLFAGLVLLHAGLVFMNLQSGILVGLEFRQAQTAISAHFIHLENNFSLAYPTPVLGKPWSIPMEFPLYQWSVAWLGNVTGWSLTVCARVLSAASFYVMLAALFRLLGQLGMTRGRRLVVLAVVLSSPLYIFYSRAFLIEAMAMAFAVWFLAAFIETMRRRSWFWLGVTIACGMGAALVKVTTFMLWCLPAAIYGAILLWRGWQSGRWRVAIPILAWGLAASLPVLAVSWWWVRVSDGIKRLNAAGPDLVSSNLVTYHFGDVADRLSPKIWGDLFRQWNTGVMPWWLAAGTGVLALLFLRSQRRVVLLAFGLFMAGQLIFPRLYSIHDYYFYAAGVGLLVAAGCVLAGLFDNRRLPRALVWGLAAAVILGNLNHYRAGYYQLQKVVSDGGSGLADAIRNTAPPGSVLIITGDDWNSMLPYYSRRRALMIRRHVEHSWDYIERAFDDLRGEDIYGLVAMGDQRGNREFIARAARRFDLDQAVTYSYGDKADVYVRRLYRNDVLNGMGTNEQPYYNQVMLKGQAEVPKGSPRMDGVDRRVDPSERTTVFADMHPAPVRYNFAFNITRIETEGRTVIGAHPPSALWFESPAGARRIQCEFGILADAYASAGGHTDGAEFTIRERRRDGTERIVYHRRLDPFTQPADRGVQTVTLNFAPADGAELCFETGFGGGGNFDWCYWGKIRID